MINVIVDGGNYNYKVWCEGKELIFSSKITKIKPQNSEAFERVEINGVTTFISTGELQREFDKAKKDYLAQIMYAVSKITTENDVNLCILLPVVQIDKSKAMKQQLENNLFKCKINNVERNIKVNKVAIVPEGYSAFFNEEVNSDTLIIDIGSRTINFAAFTKKVGQDTFTIEDNWTEKLGIFDLYTRIKDVENEVGNDYIEEDIERLIHNKVINVQDKMYEDFLVDILNRAKSRINLKMYTNIVFIGGGSLVLKDFIEKYTPGKVHKNAIYANVLGAKELAKKAWGNK